MAVEIRDEADRLYALWQLDARNRGRLHEFLRAITRARAAADAATTRSGRGAWPRLSHAAEDALEEARRILISAGARP